jgi:chromosomal replication initiator protein DnaA
MLDKLKDDWDKIIYILQEEHNISDVSVQTWLTKLNFVNFSNNCFTAEVMDPNPMFLDVIKLKYQNKLSVIISGFYNSNYNVEFVTHNNNSSKNVPKPTNTTINSIINKANLNPRYTFDTFVVGTNNQLAHAASLAVAESPAEIYNPFFIYGGVGLGKTHLMHSVAHFIIKNNQASKVLYVTSEKFTNELIDSIRNKNNFSTTEFREKYRNIDVLLIDDIQFIIGKESTQEEFFHTFNSLYEAGKQIIISSDKPPKDIETLEERLRSRFEMGLTVDIQAPDYETRMAILRKKEELENYNIDNEVIKYIATNVKSNIRELEGALTKIVALSKLNRKEINLELAEDALKDLISPNNEREVTPELIINIVSEHYNITPIDIVSQKRNRDIVYPRQIVMYLCRELTNVSLQQIGKCLGGRDHTTILHGCDKIVSDIKTNETFKNTIDIIKKKINPS